MDEHTNISSDSVHGPSKPSPWLMLPPAFDGGDMVYKFYKLAENEVVGYNNGGKEEIPAVIVGSSDEWLALFDKRNCDLFLLNPLSRRRIKLLSINTLSIPKEYLKDGHMCVHRVILSCSADDEECRALMSFGPKVRPACCWPGRSREWTPLIPGRKARSYADFVYSRSWKLFFCMMDYLGKFEAWDLRNPQSPRMIPIALTNWDEDDIIDMENYPCAELDNCSTVRSLVAVEHEIYHVKPYIVDQIALDGSSVDDMRDKSFPYKTIYFDVYKDVPEDKVFRLLPRSFDDLAFFIGHNHGFALSAKKFPEVKSNSIYFTDAMEPVPIDVLSNMPYGGHDIGVFDYTKRKISSCYYPCDVQSIKKNSTSSYVVPANDTLTWQ